MKEKETLKCSVCGGTEEETNKIYGITTGHLLCSRHYYQLKRHGEIKDRTRHDKNEYEMHDDFAFIRLYNVKGEISANAIIDLEDVNKCKPFKWYLEKHERVTSCIDKKQVKLHRFVLNAPKNCVVDHINRNPLDNRKSNLRLCSIQENSFNSDIYKSNTSGVTGICWDKSRNKWEAYIYFNYKKIHLGRFDNFNEAVKVRKEAEQKYFGEFSPIHDND